MKISKRMFYLITFMFFLMPFSVHWRLLLFGKRTEGIVVGYAPETGVLITRYDPPKYSIIQFDASHIIYNLKGPYDVVYPLEKELPIYYNKKNPNKFLVFTFAGILLNYKMILPAVTFLIWLSFYTAFNTGEKSK